MFESGVIISESNMIYSKVSIDSSIESGVIISESNMIYS